MMQNKSKKRWLDIQIILASLAVTATMGLWNLFARGSRPAANPASPQPPEPAYTFTYTPTATATEAATATLEASTAGLIPQVHMLLGGNKPVPRVVLAALPSSGDSGNQVSSSTSQSSSSTSQSSTTTSQVSVPNPAPNPGALNNNPAPMPAPAPVPAPPPVTNTGSSKP